MMTSADQRVASNVKFAMIDLRYQKRPKLNTIFKRPTKKQLLQQKPPKYTPIIEVDPIKFKNNPDSISKHDFKHLGDYHVVLITTHSIDKGSRDYCGKCEEMRALKKVLDLFKRRSFVGILKNGAQELFQEASLLKRENKDIVFK